MTLRYPFTIHGRYVLVYVNAKRARSNPYITSSLFSFFVFLVFTRFDIFRLQFTYTFSVLHWKSVSNVMIS
jgi:hypothetical protein